MRLGVLCLLLPVALLSLACGDDDAEPDHEWISTAKVVDKHVEENLFREWGNLDPSGLLDIIVLDDETAILSQGSIRYLLTLRSGGEPPEYDLSIEDTLQPGSSRDEEGCREPGDRFYDPNLSREENCALFRATLRQAVEGRVGESLRGAIVEELRARFRLSIRPLDSSRSGYDVIVRAACYNAMDIGADWPSSAPECN